MVNIFGQNVVQGKVGPRGFPGLDGDKGPKGNDGNDGAKGDRGEAGSSGIIDLFNWLPKSLLDNFQVNSEQCCFFIIKGGKDVEFNSDVDKTVKKWISKSLTSTNGGKKHSKKYALLISDGTTADDYLKIDYLDNDQGYFQFKKSLLKVDNVWLTNTYSFLCLTFKASKDLSEGEEQWIVSNWESKKHGRVFRGVSISKGKIHIHGCQNDKYDYLTIDYDISNWTTLFVEWSDNGVLNGSFDINSGKYTGNFTAIPSSDILPPCVFIGGRSDNDHYFEGCLASVEWASFTENNATFPKELKKLITTNQLIQEEEEEEEADFEEEEETWWGQPPYKKFANFPSPPPVLK